MKRFILLMLVLSLCLSIISCTTEIPNSDKEQQTTDQPSTPEPPNTPEHTCVGEQWEVVEEASCTKEGLKQYICSCGKVVDTATIPVSSHTFESGSCTECATPDPDYKPTASEGLEYEGWDGVCYVVGMGTCTDTDIVIPEVSPDGDTVIGVFGLFVREDGVELEGSYTLRLPSSAVDINFYGCSQLTKVFFEDGAEMILDGAFAYCENLTTVSLGNGVKSIGEEAFRGCKNLTTVFIGNGLETIGINAFLDCSSLNKIDIPDTVTTISGGAFQNCTSLKKIVIPDGVNLIDSFTFMDCTNLESVVLGNGVKNIGQFVFSGCANLTDITIPSSLKKIDIWAFKDCEKLNSVYIQDLYSWCRISSAGSDPLDYGADLYLNGQLLSELIIPDDLTNFGSAFGGCTSLVSVTIPHGTPTISKSAFEGCTKLENVIIPSSVSTIGKNAFRFCKALSKVTIPDGVVSIGDTAFGSCTGLLEIILPASVTSLGSRCFEDCYALKSVTINSPSFIAYSAQFAGCSALTAINVPDALADSYRDANGWKDIENVWSGLPPVITVSQGLEFTSNKDGTCYVSGIGTCTDRVIVIPETSPDGQTVTGIKSEAFKQCYKITKVIIPDTVTTIGARAFEDCSSLVKLDIPSSVTQFTYMFGGCNSLTTLILRSSTMLDWASPPMHVSGSPYDRITLYVPEELVDEYQKAFGWMAMKDRIMSINEQ